MTEYRFLERLTDDDRVMLTRQAERRTYDAGEVILEEGSHRTALFIVHAGEVRVQRSHMGFDLEVARLGGGEIFGEMSLVEDVPASASVVADDRVEVEIIEAGHVRALIERDVGFYGRFYHSLALILSRRLRETTSVGIAEYSWGGHDLAAEAEHGGEAHGDWGGGSPVRGDG